jgi:uncharacterized glyoxalase superfamily protein PhnB
MIHVPDVSAAVTWYASIGFQVLGRNEEDGELNWARLAFGNSQIMFDCAGKASDAHRREVDLYILTDGVDTLYSRLKDKAEIVEAPHDTFYGMREFIIRDLNRFWITFGEPLRREPNR